MVSPAVRYLFTKGKTTDPNPFGQNFPFRTFTLYGTTQRTLYS